MKSREDREHELLKLAGTNDGILVIAGLWNQIKGIPLGGGIVGTLVRQEMIEDILKHEYPNS